MIASRVESLELHGLLLIDDLDLFRSASEFLFRAFRFESKLSGISEPASKETFVLGDEEAGESSCMH